MINVKNFLLLLIFSYFGTFLRLYVDNNFIISICGSFLFGFIIARRLGKSLNYILLGGFCSCFTSFSGFIIVLHRFINQEDVLKIVLYLNIIFISNLLMMYFGFMISRKIT